MPRQPPGTNLPYSPLPCTTPCRAAGGRRPPCGGAGAARTGRRAAGRIPGTSLWRGAAGIGAGVPPRLGRRSADRTRPARAGQGAEGARRPPQRGCGRRVGSLSRRQKPLDRKSVVSGKSVSVRVDLGGRRNIKKKKQDKIGYTLYDIIKNMKRLKKNKQR